MTPTTPQTAVSNPHRKVIHSPPLTEPDGNGIATMLPAAQEWLDPTSRLNQPNPANPLESPSAPAAPPPIQSVQDSGRRVTYPSGSQRDSSLGKGAFSLLAILPLFRLAFLYETGDAKYGTGSATGQPRNWEQGQPFSRLYESALRHLFQWALGFHDEDHLAQACWNLFALMHFEETGRTDLNDLPTYSAETRNRLRARMTETGIQVQAIQAARTREAQP